MGRGDGGTGREYICTQKQKRETKRNDQRGMEHAGTEDVCVSLSACACVRADDDAAASERGGGAGQGSRGLDKRPESTKTRV